MITTHDKERQYNHPTPKEDTIGREPRTDEYCGFNSPVDLLHWFKGFIPGLLRVGYEIVKLDVEITAIGEYQVLFTF